MRTNLANIGEFFSMRKPERQEFLAIVINFDLPLGFDTGPLKAKINPPDAAEQTPVSHDILPMLLYILFYTVLFLIPAVRQ